MNFFEPQKTVLNGGRLRLLPYAMLGAFLISLRSASSISGVVENYLLLLGIECVIVLSYLIAVRKIKLSRIAIAKVGSKK